MQGFSDSVRSAAQELERIENEREGAIACSRTVIRLSKRTVHAIHVGDDCSGPASEMEEALRSLLSTYPDAAVTGPVQDAMMEYAEAVILASIVTEGRVPSHSELGIPRIVTARLMDGDMDRAKGFFEIMEEVSGELMMLDIPDAVAPVRRKQDIARGIMDRTRSDMTTAAIINRI